MTPSTAAAVANATKEDSLQTFFSWAKSIGIEIRQGHVAFGNDKMQSIAVVGFKKLVGMVKLDKPKCALDVYRFTVDMNWEDGALCFKKNPGVYVETPEHHINRISQYEEEYVKKKNDYYFFYFLFQQQNTVQLRV